MRPDPTPSRPIPDDRSSRARRARASMSKVVMIGYIDFTHRGAPAQAMLHDDGRWTCNASRAVETALNRDFSPIGKPSASGNWGEWELLAAAHSLRGTPHLGSPTPPADPPATEGG